MLQKNWVLVKGKQNVTFLLNLHLQKCKVNYSDYLRDI